MNKWKKKGSQIKLCYFYSQDISYQVTTRINLFLSSFLLLYISSTYVTSCKLEIQLTINFLSISKLYTGLTCTLLKMVDQFQLSDVTTMFILNYRSTTENFTSFIAFDGKRRVEVSEGLYYGFSSALGLLSAHQFVIYDVC